MPAILVPGCVLIPVNSFTTVLPILFLQSYSTKIQLHFNGGIVFFPPSSLLCLLWARNSFARDSITHWHCQGSDNMGWISFRIPLRGMRACVWVMHNFISPDTGPEEVGTNCTCKLTKQRGMAAHKVIVQTWMLHRSCMSAFRHWKRKDICFPWWNLQFQEILITERCQKWCPISGKDYFSSVLVLFWVFVWTSLILCILMCGITLVKAPPTTDAWQRLLGACFWNVRNALQSYSVQNIQRKKKSLNYAILSGWGNKISSWKTEK